MIFSLIICPYYNLYDQGNDTIYMTPCLMQIFENEDVYNHPSTFKQTILLHTLSFKLTYLRLYIMNIILKGPAWQIWYKIVVQKYRLPELASQKDIYIIYIYEYASEQKRYRSILPIVHIYIYILVAIFITANIMYALSCIFTECIVIHQKYSIFVLHTDSVGVLFHTKKNVKCIVYVRRFKASLLPNI